MPEKPGVNNQDTQPALSSFVSYVTLHTPKRRHFDGSLSVSTAWEEGHISF
jgi:hypothetical protein